jgi:sugar lactone lactonase YvrE
MTTPPIDELLRLLPDRVEPDAGFEAQLRARLTAELHAAPHAGTAPDPVTITSTDPSTDPEVHDLEATTNIRTTNDRGPLLRVAAVAAAVAIGVTALALVTRSDEPAPSATVPDATFVDATLETLALDAGPDDPYFVAAEADAWVLSLAGDLIRIDATTGAETGVRRVSEASLLAVDPDAVWIADGVRGTVLRIDPDDGSVVAEIETGIEVLPSTVRLPMPEGAAREFSLIGGIASDGESVWVGDRAERVLVIDPDRNEVVSTFDVPVRPDQVQVVGDLLLVTNLTGGEVAVVDAADGAVVRQVELDDLAGAALHDGALYLQRSSDGTVIRIDLDSGEQRTSVPLGPSVQLIGQPVLPTGLVVSAAGVLVDTDAPDSLHVLDPTTLAEQGTLATPPDHGDMAISADGSVWMVRANAHEVVHITPRPL